MAGAQPMWSGGTGNSAGYAAPKPVASAPVIHLSTNGRYQGPKAMGSETPVNASKLPKGSIIR